MGGGGGHRHSVQSLRHPHTTPLHPLPCLIQTENLGKLLETAVCSLLSPAGFTVSPVPGAILSGDSVLRLVPQVREHVAVSEVGRWRKEPRELCDASASTPRAPTWLLGAWLLVFCCLRVHRGPDTREKPEAGWGVGGGSVPQSPESHLTVVWTCYHNSVE